MRKGLTEVVFILDRSGSMAGLEADTIGGFNAMLEKQRGVPGEVLVSTVLFDHETEVVHDRVRLENVHPLDGETYYVRGSTALLDALGGAITHISNVHKYARPEDVPENTLFVVTTDGLENASCIYSARRVKDMVKRKQAKSGWEFLFLGANIDAVEAAGYIGIRPEHAAEFLSDGEGTRLNYDVLGDAIVKMRACSVLDDSWKQRIDSDYKKRKPAKRK